MIALFKERIGKDMSDSSSAVGRLLNGTLLEAEIGYLEVRYLVREDMLNSALTLHGGMIATMLDDVIGGTAMTLVNEKDDHFFSTLNINVDYFYPAFLNDVLIVKSRLVKKGKNVHHIQAELFNNKGKMLAKAISNLAKTEYKWSDLMKNNPFFGVK